MRLARLSGGWTEIDVRSGGRSKASDPGATNLTVDGHTLSPGHRAATGGPGAEAHTMKVKEIGATW
jgi:hypothetical protein